MKYPEIQLIAIRHCIGQISLLQENSVVLKDRRFSIPRKLRRTRDGFLVINQVQTKIALTEAMAAAFSNPPPRAITIQAIEMLDIDWPNLTRETSFTRPLPSMRAIKGVESRMRVVDRTAIDQGSLQ